MQHGLFLTSILVVSSNFCQVFVAVFFQFQDISIYLYYCRVLLPCVCVCKMTLVMGLLTLPYVAYHDLRVKAFVFVQVHYPKALTQVYSSWAALKSFGIPDSWSVLSVSVCLHYIFSSPFLQCQKTELSSMRFLFTPVDMRAALLKLFKMLSSKLPPWQIVEGPVKTNHTHPLMNHTYLWMGRAYRWRNHVHMTKDWILDWSFCKILFLECTQKVFSTRAPGMSVHCLGVRPV